MAEYLIQDTTLTNLADKIRVLSGTEGTMTPAVMNSNLVAANTELDNQDVLIEQLKAALEGKAAGGGGSAGSIETCTLSVDVSTSTKGSFDIYYTELSNGTLAAKTTECAAGSQKTIICVKNTAVVVVSGYGDYIMCESGAEWLSSETHVYAFNMSGNGRVYSI